MVAFLILGSFSVTRFPFHFLPSFHFSFPDETDSQLSPAGGARAQTRRTYAQVAGVIPLSGARPRRQVRVPERYKEATVGLQRRRHVSSSSSRGRPDPQTARQTARPGPASAPASLSSPPSSEVPAAKELCSRSERRAEKGSTAREKEKRAKK